MKLVVRVALQVAFGNASFFFIVTNAPISQMLSYTKAHLPFSAITAEVLLGDKIIELFAPISVVRMEGNFSARQS